jgi:hypothetical protein
MSDRQVFEPAACVQPFGHPFRLTTATGPFQCVVIRMAILDLDFSGRPLGLDFLAEQIFQRITTRFGKGPNFIQDIDFILRLATFNSRGICCCRSRNSETERVDKSMITS